MQDTLWTYYGTKNTREKIKIFKNTEYRIHCGHIMVLKIHERRIKYLKIQNAEDIRIQDKRRKEG